jgi:hypothetical protein
VKRGRDPAHLEFDPDQPFQRVQVPDDVAETLAYFASMAAHHEALRPWPPVSSVRNPDGSTQRETPAEYISRVTAAGVLHLVETGLLVVPDDFAARSSGFLPLSRED